MAIRALNSKKALWRSAADKCRGCSCSALGCCSFFDSSSALDRSSISNCFCSASAVALGQRVSVSPVMSRADITHLDAAGGRPAEERHLPLRYVVHCRRFFPLHEQI